MDLLGNDDLGGILQQAGEDEHRLPDATGYEMAEQGDVGVGDVAVGDPAVAPVTP
jgi:hypothetical protein